MHLPANSRLLDMVNSQFGTARLVLWKMEESASQAGASEPRRFWYPFQKRERPAKIKNQSEAYKRWTQIKHFHSLKMHAEMATFHMDRKAKSLANSKRYLSVNLLCNTCVHLLYNIYMRKLMAHQPPHPVNRGGLILLLCLVLLAHWWLMVIMKTVLASCLYLHRS